MFVPKEEKPNSKPAATFSIPVPIAKSVDEMRELQGLHSHQKWAIVSAALIHFLDRTHDERAFYIDAVTVADRGTEAFERLVKRAKSGGLRRQAQDVAELLVGVKASFASKAAAVDPQFVEGGTSHLQKDAKPKG